VTKSRAVTPRPPASSLAARVAIEVEVDGASADMVIAAGARLGVDVHVRSGATRVVLDDTDTLAHHLRTEVLAAANAPVDLAHGASARAKRCLAGLASAATARSSAIVREESDGRLTLILRDRLPVDLGEAPEAARAIRAARTRRAVAETESAIELPPEAEARARAITFGPARTLSDPSSRRVLEAFGIACAPWRLAETAARAAAHARAIGYPIDLRVASPDISAIDDERFAATELRTPGEVREAFRTLTREVRRIAPEARVLGATVTRHLPGAPRLRIALSRAGGDRLRIELDDPIGRKLSRPLLAAAPLDLAGAARLIDGFDGREVLPRADSPLGLRLLDLLVRLSRAAIVLADTLTGAEIAPLVPDGEGWSALAARISVRGIAES
jgi:hypothetical protein